MKCTVTKGADAIRYGLSENDFEKAERGRRIGHTSTNDNAAKIIIWKSIDRHHRIDRFDRLLSDVFSSKQHP